MLVRVDSTTSMHEACFHSERSTSSIHSVIARTADIHQQRAPVAERCSRRTNDGRRLSRPPVKRGMLYGGWNLECGVVGRWNLDGTVGYIQEKAKILHAVRVNDSIEAEKLRLSHLRDRASETGRRKQYPCIEIAYNCYFFPSCRLQECVEKLQLLNNPDERRRRLIEAPQIHADPKMDPEYESLEEAEDDKNQDSQIKSKGALSLRKRRELIPRGRAGNNWNDMHRSPKFNHDSCRRTQGEFGLDTSFPNEALLNQSKDLYQSEASFADVQAPSPRNFIPKSAQQPHSAAPEINPAAPNEADKIWFYVDPSNNMQGPFSLTQLRKWSTTGYFPPDMRIWRTAEKQEDSILLTDVLSGRFYTQHASLPHPPNRGNWNPHQNANQPILDGLPSQTPGWSQKPAGPVYHNPYHNPAFEDAGRGGSNGELNQEQDCTNLWSPTRPSSADTVQVDHNVTLDPPFTNERNSGINKYRTFESDCPSPTPRTENLQSNPEFADPLRKIKYEFCRNFKR
ncbi:Zinc finger CCCH domain-containing protein 19 [Platanthera guangdongensis]|uniref:Zinc finger CCCH domain-containing protein 19 n=1 Tax=Platanthera guangdongensis TaxID=2320717 RepID=A0ABR2MPZ9_9ASPA